MPKLTRQDVQIMQQTTAYQGFYTLKQMVLRHRLFAGGWSQPMTREVVVRTPAVAVLLYDASVDSVVMVEQFRIGALDHAQGPWQLELVAGMIDTQESPQQVAVRECQEEAGITVTAESLMPIVNYLVSPGGSDESLTIYYAAVDASVAGGIHGVATENEDIRVVVHQREALWQALQPPTPTLPVNTVETADISTADQSPLNPINITNAATIVALQWLQLNYQQL